MKKYTVFLSLFALIASGNAQELWTKKEVNKDARLTHHVMFHSTNDTLVANCKQRFNELITEKELSFSVFDRFEEKPDVVFLLDDMNNGYAESIRNHGTPVFVNPSRKNKNAKHIKGKNSGEIAQNAVELMARTYYQGVRPSYSDIFTYGERDYPCFRIPSVAVLANGRILTFIESRNSFTTDCEENDILMKYSDDNGKSWSEMIVVASNGSYSMNNPMAIYLEESNEVLLIIQQYPPKTHEVITKTGSEGDDVTRIFVLRSKDNGETWSEKTDITADVKLPKVSSQASGPGIAIQVKSGKHKGRIIIPFNAVGGIDGWYNYLVYSDDMGKSWQILEGRSQYGTNESQLVETGDGSFLINARCHRFEGDEDLAPKGWSPWNFNRVTRSRGFIPVEIDGEKAAFGKTIVRTDLPDPLCQGGTTRYSGLNKKEKSVLMFTNPASDLTDAKTERPYQNTPPMRINGTIALSYDDGETWPVRKRIYGNRYTEFQYSVPVRLKDNKIGVIFEANEKIKFAVFDLEWLEAN